MSFPLARPVQNRLKHVRALSLSNTKHNDPSSLHQVRSRSVSCESCCRSPKLSLSADDPQTASLSDKPPVVSRGMATITTIPKTISLVPLHSTPDGLSVKPSPVVMIDGPGPFSSPCLELGFTATECASEHDMVALSYKFRSPPSHDESPPAPKFNVPLTSHVGWTDVSTGTGSNTRLKYQSSPLNDTHDSSHTKKAVVRTKMIITTPSLSSITVHSVFIVKSTRSGPQVQHVLPSNPLFCGY